MVSLSGPGVLWVSSSQIVYISYQECSIHMSPGQRVPRQQMKVIVNVKVPNKHEQIIGQ